MRFILELYITHTDHFIKAMMQQPQNGSKSCRNRSGQEWKRNLTDFDAGFLVRARQTAIKKPQTS